MDNILLESLVPDCLSENLPLTDHYLFKEKMQLFKSNKKKGYFIDRTIDLLITLFGKGSLPLCLEQPPTLFSSPFKTILTSHINLNEKILSKPVQHWKTRKLGSKNFA